MTLQTSNKVANYRENVGKMSRDTLKNSQTPMENKTADLVLLVDYRTVEYIFLIMFR